MYFRLFAILCWLAGIQAAAATGHDWPRLLGPNGDGKSAEAILHTWPDGGLEVVWFESVGEGYGSPAIAGFRFFLFDRIDDQARLRAFDAADGTELWSSTYTTHFEDQYAGSDGPRSSPVVDARRVFVFGAEGRLRAHDTESGQLLWDIDTSRRFGVVPFYFGVGASPLVEEDLLIVPIGGSPANSPRLGRGPIAGNGTGIVAFDKSTGAERYRLTDELASYSSPVAATIDGQRWGFAFTRGGLVGFDPARGTQRFFFPWRAKQLASANAANPVVVDDTVFLTETYGAGATLLRILPDRAEPIWRDSQRKPSLRSHWATPIAHAGVLYGSSGRATGEAELMAVDHRSGKVLWREPGLGRSTMLFADGHLLVLTEHGRLLLVEATPDRFVQKAEMDFSTAQTSGDRLLRPQLGFPAWNAPALSRGRLYLKGKDHLICLDVGPAQ